MFPEFSVNKIVPLRFAGVDIRLKTTHALFSSHHVDDGTMLLLKTLAQRSSVPISGRVLDAGCGVGPLAVALKKFRPALKVTARDRLVLASAYTTENARFNGVELDVAPGLLLDGTPGPWDLIVSNLPAKAGESVLKDFVTRSLSLLSSGGLVAVVVVAPLAGWLGDVIGEKGELVYREAAPGYEVFHYRRRLGTELGEPPFPRHYFRGEITWKAAGASLYQKTFYGLPNFDALDYRLQVTLPLLEKLKIPGDCLVWEPVQGHLAVWALQGMAERSTLFVAGNDVLGLAAAAENCLPKPVTIIPASYLKDVGIVPVGTVLAQLHPEPEVPWAESTALVLKDLLLPGGCAVVNGRSTDLTRLLEYRTGLHVVRDERSKGWRAVMLRKPG